MPHCFLLWHPREEEETQRKNASKQLRKEAERERERERESMASQQLQRRSQFSFIISSTPLLLLSLLLLLHAPPSSSSGISLLKFWNSHLPSTDMPPSLAHRISPLTPVSLLRSLWRIKTGGLLSSSFAHAFCNSANLVCDANAGLLNPGVSEERDNAVDKTQLFVGSQISLPDIRTHPHQHAAAFLPTILSHRLPFRNESLAGLLQMLHIPSSSPLALHMQTTLSLCDEMASQKPGETVTCATSVEQMVQFAISTLGSSDLEILQPSLTIGEGWEQNMTVTGFRARESWRAVDCRELLFPYAVFLCETKDQKMQIVEVDLDGRRGKGKAVVQCHSSRSENGEGGAEVCEWMSEESLVWGRRAEESMMAWRNEKFSLFRGGQSDSTNVWNLNVKKNTFKNHGDVNFNSNPTSDDVTSSTNGPKADSSSSSNTSGEPPTNDSTKPNLTSGGGGLSPSNNQNLSTDNLTTSDPNSTNVSHNPTSSSTSNTSDGSSSADPSSGAGGTTTGTGGGGGGAGTTTGTGGGGGGGGKGRSKGSTSTTTQT